MKSYFTTGGSSGTGPVDLRSKRLLDRDLQLASSIDRRSFRSQAVRVLGIKKHEGGRRPPIANKNKWSVLNAALSKYHADLEKALNNDEYRSLWSRLDASEDYLRTEDPNILPIHIASGEAVDQSEQPEPTHSQKMSKLLKLLQLGLLHVWSKCGQHVRFCSREEYQAICLRLIGLAPANSTA